MFFYKYVAQTNNNWSEIYNNREKFDEIRRKTKHCNISYNNNTYDKKLIIVSSLDEEEIRIVIATEEYLTVTFDVENFISYLPFSLNKGELEEMLIKDFGDEINEASHQKLYYGHDESVKRIGIEWMDRYYCSFEEERIMFGKRKQLDNKVSYCYCKKTLMPELDRIYQGSKENIPGNVVHYVVKTDSDEVGLWVPRVLLSALKNNNRIKLNRFSKVTYNIDDDADERTLKGLYETSTNGAIVIRFQKSCLDGDSEIATADIRILLTVTRLMKAYQNKVLTILSLPRESSKMMKRIYEELESISLVEIEEDFVSFEEIKKIFRNKAKLSGIKTNKRLFDKLDKTKKYYLSDLDKTFSDWMATELKTFAYPQYKDIGAAYAKITKDEDKGSAYDELMRMVGIKEAKAVINKAIAFNKARKIYADKGFPKLRPSMHYCFTGSPGTAKTSVARLIASIYRENGILSRGHLVECGRAELTGRYVGWTDKIVKEKFAEANGGVLFIDEAYSLCEAGGYYGDEAINTIVQEMENHRDDTIVIFAGYKDKMEEFLQKNPGLRSRISFHVNFEDYNKDELVEITKLLAEKMKYKISDGAIKKMEKIYENACTKSEFGNGRFCRNILEQAVMKQATRLIEADFENVTKEDVTTILEDDIDIPSGEHDKKEMKVIGFTAA